MFLCLFMLFGLVGLGVCWRLRLVVVMVFVWGFAFRGLVVYVVACCLLC